MEVKKDTYKPTELMKVAAKRALEWRKEFGRGGTRVGIARARDIVNDKNLPIETVARMYSYFSRHEVDKKAEGFNKGEKGFPSNGRIAWCLSGDTNITLSNGTSKTIKEIVDNKLDCEVLSYNIELDKIETKKIINWYKNNSKSNEFIFVKQYKKGSRYRGIRITPEHPIFSLEEGWIKPYEILNKHSLYLEKTFNQIQHEILLGCCLGDACITQSLQYRSLSANLTLSHSEKQKDYLIEKARLLNIENQLTYQIAKSGFGKDSVSVRFKTSFPALTHYRNDMYPNGKKEVSEEWLNELTDISIAFWFMDDGSLHNVNNKSNTYRLHTEGFNIESIDRISKYFNKKKWKHSVLKRENCDGYYISFSQKITDSIAKTISPYICDSMLYKLPKNFRNRKYLLHEVNTNYINYLEHVKINSITELSREGSANRIGLSQKYNITVEDNNNYFANGMLVHNCLWGGDDGYRWATKIWTDYKNENKNIENYEKFLTPSCSDTLISAIIDLSKNQK